MAFPNVPNVPGVPAIPRDPAIAFAAISLLTRDLQSAFLGSLQPQWGIFLNGAPVVFGDSVISFDYKRDWNVSDYPLEKGAFESYDKVEVPFTTRLRFSCGGSQERRQVFLESVQAIAGTLKLYDAVTPEKIYNSVNVIHYDYRRSGGHGLGLIVVDIWLLEVRVKATQTFSNVKSPSAANATQGGIVQTTTPTAAQTSAVAATPSGAGY